MVHDVADDPGVMGNLPRSRPGRRSEKRASGGSTGGAAKRASGGGAAKPKAARASAKAAAGGSRGKAATGGSRAKAGASATGSARAGRSARERSGEQAPPTAVREERIEQPQGQDPVTAALRLGMAVGDAGLKVVAKLARRLPRP